MLLSGAAQPFGPEHGGDAVRRSTFRPCRAGDPAGGRPRRDRAVRPLPRFQPRLPGRRPATSSQRFMAALEQVAINGMMPDYDADLRPRPGRGAEARRRAARQARPPTASRRRRSTIHRRRREAYLAIAAAEPERCIVIDASPAAAAVEERRPRGVRAAVGAGGDRRRAGGGAGMILERIAPEPRRLDGVPEPVREPAAGRPCQLPQRCWRPPIAPASCRTRCSSAGPLGIGKATLAFHLAHHL